MTSVWAEEEEENEMNDRPAVYRIELDAYNSRASYPGSMWTVDVRAWDTDDALSLLRTWARFGLRSPVGVTAGGTCRHAQPCFMDHRERVSYPEWRIIPDGRGRLARRRTGIAGASQSRRPLVWLGRNTPVVVVKASCWRGDPAGEREPVLVWEFGN